MSECLTALLGTGYSSYAILFVRNSKKGGGSKVSEGGAEDVEKVEVVL